MTNFLNQDGFFRNIQLTSRSINTSNSSNYMLEIAAGNITGVSTINKFGANSLILDSTTEDVWDVGGTYNFPTTADITHISQSADQVTLRNGTIEVQGLDVNWNLTIQNVSLNTLNTTTLVALTTPLIRVFRMKVLENVINTQNINLTNSLSTIFYARIQPSNNQTLMSIYTIPRGKTGYMVRYWADGIQALGKEPRSVSYKLWVADRDNNYEFQLKHARASSKGSSSIDNCFNPFLKITQKSDIKITATPFDEDTDVFAGFDIILVDN